MIEGHLDGILHTADLKFMRHGGKLVEHRLATGTYDDRKAVEDMTDYLESILDEAIGLALTELRDNLEIGSADWIRHHDYLVAAFEKRFERIVRQSERQTDDLANDQRLHVFRLGKCVADQKARIYRQQAGWNVEKRPWHERYWLGAKIVEWAIPATLGAGVTIVVQALLG